MNNTIRILIIDDNQADFVLLQSTFKQIETDIKYILDHAPTYQEGLQTVLSTHYDLCFVDYKLGANDGIDLLREAHVNGCRTPFILLTGMMHNVIGEQAKEKGLYGYLEKSELSPFFLERTITYAIERKLIEEDLRKQKQTISYIIGEIPYLLVTIGQSGEIIMINPYACEMLGKSEDEVIGQNWRNILLNSHSFDSFSDPIGKDTFEGYLTDANGKIRQIKWNVLNKNIDKTLNSDLSFVLSGKDMTAEKDREAEERQREKAEALGHLAGGVAHEINNLLQPILFASDILKSDGANEKHIPHLEKIVRNTKSAGKIVEDILTYARKDAEDNQPMPVIATLLSMMDFIEDMIPTTIKINDNGLDKKDVHQSKINTTDLYRVIQNICNNGAQAMNNDGILHLSSCIVQGNKTGLSSLHPDQQYIGIKIQDHGSGIPKNILPKLTDPFFTTKQVGEGTGLGLAIVYNIIRNWNGGLHIDSTEGKGTIMTVYLPIYEGN